MSSISEVFELSTRTVVEYAETWQRWMGTSEVNPDSVVLERLRAHIISMEEQIYSDKEKLSSVMTIKSWYVTVAVVLITCTVVLLLSKYYYDAKCEAWKWKSTSYLNQIEQLDSEATKAEFHLSAVVSEREGLISKIQELGSHLSLLETQKRVDNVQLLEICKTSHKIQTRNAKDLADRNSEIIFERNQFIVCKEGLETYIVDLKTQVELGKKICTDREEYHLKQIQDYESIVRESKTLMDNMVASRDMLIVLSDNEVAAQTSQRRIDRCKTLSSAQENDHLATESITMADRLQYLEIEYAGAVKLICTLRAENEELNSCKLILTNRHTELRAEIKKIERQCLLVDTVNSSLHNTISGLNADLENLRARLLHLSAGDVILTARINELESQCIITGNKITATESDISMQPLSLMNKAKTWNVPHTPNSGADTLVLKSLSPSTDEEAEEDGEEEGAQEDVDGSDDDDQSVGSAE